MEPKLDPQQRQRQQQPHPWRAYDRSKLSSRLRVALVAVAIIALLLHSLERLLPPQSGILVPSGDKVHDTSLSPFRWSSIEPSKELEYHDCYDGLQCARLDVPMDYHAPPGSLDRVALAIIRKPAKVPVSDPRYGGAVLINPGGPGGSGVAKLLYHGSQIQQVVDSDRPVTAHFAHDSSGSEKYFDIIGFDPRGINHSTPLLTCFPDNFARQIWNMQTEAEGILGSSEGSLRINWRRARAFADGCSRRLESDQNNNNATNFLEHVNTTPVARDMLEIIERHGQWRAKQGSQAQAIHDMMHGHDPSQQIVERTKWQPGEEQLLYWGYSYGTLLGATFVAMYPDRVSRVVLDGVVDAQDYYNGPWLQNLHDTDKILHKIMDYCSEAGPGPEGCAFWRPGGPQAILAAYEKLLHDIWDDPLSVVGSDTRGPEIITWTDLKMLIRDALYQPVMLGPLMAELMQDVTNGTGSLFATYKQSARKPACRSAQCEVAGPFSEECVAPDWNELEATSAVLCTDAQDIGSLTEDEFQAYWRVLQGQSSAMGDYWAQTRLSCAGWATSPKWRFHGPVAANNTAHPVLWIANTLDTVTPLQSAKKMNERFPGSVLLQQDAEGHCSITAPSLCTAKSVRKYFQTGTLPEPGTVCKSDVKPFGVKKKTTPEEDGLDMNINNHVGWSEDDVRLLKALMEMAETASSIGRW
ncbi:uncharacterized protein Z518_09556 [Rhinocladiella mackenziei CBS 650.93]|uniref:Proteinase n=1 Tax=Rhinocladiella mackenziei CBS 650.93 TaxID=1442369 RepID=A0A0D2I7J7_9EURO|nr:uncharacterized protein Z518_09556 [Rhinocladiella mackenziei CBS 650.93]KIX01829.1 hypothetical protein Z518_09556 [Rhinocladiella mackenziei CBS 650.93]